MEAKPVVIRFASTGLNLRSVADELDPGSFNNLTNWVSDREGSVRSRYGRTALTGSPLSSLDVHSLWRLKSTSAAYRYAVSNDKLFRAVTPFTTYSQILPGATWLASRTYKVGDIVVPTVTNGHCYRCTVAGTSGAVEPSFDSTTASTTIDNTVTWVESNFSGSAVLPDDFAVGSDTKPWTFFSDVNLFIKDSGTGSPSLAGIVPPATVATVSTDAYSSKTIETFEDYTSWTETDPSAILTLSNEGTIKKVGTNSLKCVFSAAGEAFVSKNVTLDLTTFGATASTDDDLIHIYTYTTDINAIAGVLIQLSIGDTSFKERYEKELGVTPLATGIGFAETTHAAARPLAARDNVLDDATALTFPDDVTFRPETFEPASNIWTEFKIKKSEIFAVRSTDSTNLWDDVKAIRLYFQVTDAVTIYFDDWTLLGGGNLLGTDYTWKYIYRNSTTGTMSNPSAVSASPTTSPNRNAVTVTLAYSRDPQVDKIDVYRSGGSVEEYRLSSTVTNTPGAAGATTTYQDNIADAVLSDALDTDNDRPLNFAGIVLHNETLFGWGAATDPPNTIRYSKRVFVEQWPSAQLLYVGSGADKVVRLVSIGEQLFAVTLSQVYRIIGSDPTSYQPISAGFGRGMIDNMFALCAMPAGAAMICYDGVYSFPSGTKISQPIDGIFHGKTINGITSFNVDAAGKARMAFFDSKLHVHYPSGTATENDAELVFDVVYQRWEPSTQAGRSLLYEKDTKILTMGKTDGHVYQVETGTTDNGSAIALTLQTDYMHLDTPGQDKIFSDAAIDIDTGGQNVSVQFVFNNGDTSDTAQTINTTSRTLTPLTILSGAGQKALNVQLRITGSVTAAVTVYKAILYVLLEPPRRSSFQTEWTDVGYPYDKYFKELLLDIDTLGAAATVHLDLDGTDNVETFAVTTGTRRRVTLSVERDTIGKLARLRVTGTPVKLYSHDYIVDKDPPDVTIADSLEQTFGGDRYKVLKRAWISLKSTADVTLKVYCDEVLKATETIVTNTPGSGWSKVEVKLPPGVKGKLIRFVFTSSAAFKIYFESSQVEHKFLDERQGYRKYQFSPVHLA